MTNKVYSHRPFAGVSVGVSSNGESLFFAVALVNDGTSRNQIFHRDRRDTFSRPTARTIINGRLQALESNADIKFGIRFDTTMSTKDFMAQFRDRFKPEVDETDDFLVSEDTDDDVVARYRCSANEIWNRVSNLANVIVANTEVSA